MPNIYIQIFFFVLVIIKFHIRIRIAYLIKMCVLLFQRVDAC